MDITLDKYIAKKPILQAAIVGARMRAKHEKRIHNSNKFWTDSSIYQCEDIELENGNMANDGSTGIFDSPNCIKSYEDLAIDKSNLSSSFDEAYLSLDLDEEEEYEKWFEEKKTAKETLIANTTKQRAGFSNDNRDSINNSNDNKIKNNNSNRMKNSYLKNDFDLRQVVNVKRNDEQSNVSLSQWQQSPFSSENVDLSTKIQPFTNKNNKNNFKHKQQQRWGSGFNRLGGNNTFYKAKNSKVGNGNCKLFLPLLLNQIGINNCTAQKCNYCSFQKTSNHNSNSIFCCNINEINGCHPNCNCNRLMFGLNSFDALNSSLNLNPASSSFGNECNINCCSCKNKPNDLSNDINFLKQLLKISSCNNNLNNILNLSANTAGSGCSDNSRNKSFNKPSPVNCNSPQQIPASQADVTMKDHTNDNNKRTNPLQGESIASVLRISPEDLDSLPSVYFFMQQIFENGITIKLLPEQNTENYCNSPSTEYM